MDKKVRRFFMCVIGVVVCAIAVGIFKLAAFGVDPFQVFMGGLDELIAIQFGTLYVIVNVILLLFSLFFDKHYIGIATFVNLFLVGYIVDFSHNLLLGFFPDIHLIGRLIAFVIAILLICIGSAFYYVADLGVSTYDAISLILAHTWKVGQFKYIRIIADFICVAIGTVLFFLSGGTWISLLAIVGIGTILVASSMGPLIDFFIRTIAQPFLDR